MINTGGLVQGGAKVKTPGFGGLTGSLINTPLVDQFSGPKVKVPGFVGPTGPLINTGTQRTGGTLSSYLGEYPSELGYIGLQRVPGDEQAFAELQRARREESDVYSLVYELESTGADPFLIAELKVQLEQKSQAVAAAQEHFRKVKAALRPKKVIVPTVEPPGQAAERARRTREFNEGHVDTFGSPKIKPVKPSVPRKKKK